MKHFRSGGVAKAMSKSLKNGVFEARRRRKFFENRFFYDCAPPLFSEIWKQGGGTMKGIQGLTSIYNVIYAKHFQKHRKTLFMLNTIYASQPL